MKNYDDAQRMVENAINLLSDIDEHHHSIEEWQEHLHTIVNKKNRNKIYYNNRK
jgi:hypothetical protein